MRNNNGRNAFFILCLLLLVPLRSSAQGPGFTTAGTYFGLGPEQQQIHIDRFLKANDKIKNECVPELDANEFRAYFNEWLEDNPGFLSRTAQLAFTSAIIDKCNIE